MKTNLIRYFLSFLRKYIAKEILLCLLMILASLASLVYPYLLKTVIDDVFPSGNIKYLSQILLAFIILTIFRIVIMFCYTYLFESIGNNILKDLRLNVVSHLLLLPMSYYDKNKLGDVIHRVNSEVNSIQSFITISLIKVINSICIIIGLSIMLYILNSKLFLISLGIFPFIYINTRYFQPKIHANIKKSREQDADILGYIMELLNNIRLVKINTNYKFESEKLSKKLSQQIKTNLHTVKLSSSTKCITFLFSSLIPVIVLYIGGIDVISGVMTIGSLVAFIQYLTQFFNPFKDLMGLYFDGIRVSVSMKRIYDVIRLESEFDNIQNNVKVNFANQDITFKNIKFGYKEEIILKNFNLSFKAGRRYAIVGISGSGKSSILSLLCKFYKSSSGSIFIGEHNILNIDTNYLRKNINLVNQVNNLFNNTIEYNIKYGSPHSRIEDIEKVSRICCFDDYVRELPQKYQSNIGDNGTTLSGGQRQKIAIARSLLRNSSILILDEATSGIDSESEKEILDHIFKLYSNKTIIIISHRLSTIKNVDEIICINQGEIVETGNHRNLISQKGYYWELFKDQLNY